MKFIVEVTPIGAKDPVKINLYECFIALPNNDVLIFIDALLDDSIIDVQDLGLDIDPPEQPAPTLQQAIDVIESFGYRAVMDKDLPAIETLQDVMKLEWVMKNWEKIGTLLMKK